MLPRLSVQILIASAALAAALPPLDASVMILGNGDRLTGSVTKREGGRIFFHTEVLGDIVAREKDVSIVDPPPSPLPASSLAGLAPAHPPPQAPAKVATTAQGGGHGPTQVKKVRTNWAGKVELGYDNQLTNIRTVNTVARAEVERTVGPDDFLGKARYLYGKSAGLPTTDLADSEFRIRHNLDSQIFVQSDTTAGYNRVQLIDFEGQENVGMGLKALKTIRQTLDVGAGVSGQFLNASGIQEGWAALGNVFQDYAYQINGRYKLLEDVSAQYSPERRARFGLIDNPGIQAQTGTERDYAYKFHTTLQGQISRRLSLNLHFEYEFNNAILDPANRLDQRITTTLGYGF